MKISIWSDLQLHVWEQFGIEKENLSRRFFEQAHILDQVAEIHKDRKIDASVFGGDWVHLVGSHPTPVIVLTLDYFKKDRTPYIFVDGNHDLENTTSPTRWQNISNLLRDVAVEAKVPFIKTVNFQDTVDYDQIKDYDIVVLHKQPALTNEYGHKFNGVDWQRLAKTNRLVFFGHDHTRKQLADNCYVIGACMQHTFGDKGDRGMYIVDTDTWAVEFIKLKYPEFRTVKDQSEVVAGDGNYYKGKDLKEGAGIISVKTPVVFEQRIKSDGFKDILQEWLKLNDKDETHLAMLDDLLTDKVRVVKDVFEGRVVKVKMKDFVSAGEVEYDLHKGVTFLDGLNGVGKSTLTGEALYYCLFGKTTKELTGDSVIRDGCKDCFVEVEIRSEDLCYVVKRSRKAGLEVVGRGPDEGPDNLTQGLREDDKQAVLERVLGFNEAVFKAACYFSQENLMVLTGLTDGDRTDMITDLLGFEVYDDLYSKVHEKQKLFAKERESIEQKKVGIDTETQVLGSKITTNKNFIATFEASIADLREKEKGYERKILELQESLSEIPAGVDAEAIRDEYARKISEKESLRDTIRESIDHLVKDLEDKGYEHVLSEFSRQIGRVTEGCSGLERDMRRLSAEMASPVVAPDTRYDMRLEELSEEIGRLKGLYAAQERVLSKHSTEIEELRAANLNTRCDKCGSMITKENVQAFIDEKTKILEEEAAKKTEISLQIDKLNMEVSGLKSAQEKVLKDNIDRYVAERKYKIEEIQDNIADLTAKKNTMEVERDTTKDEYTRASKDRELFEGKLKLVEGAITALYKERDAAVAEATSHLEKKVRMENAIEGNKDMLAMVSGNVDDLERKIEVLKDENISYSSDLRLITNQLDEADFRIKTIDNGVEVLDFWKTAFSAKGIRAVLLDKFCNEFNESVSDYLTTVTGGQMSIVVTPTAVTKKGEERNKLGLIIHNSGNERTYKSLSGGQKRRVDISLCLALNRWVSKKYGVANGLLGLIILDEVFSFIDPSGEESMATMVYNEARNKAIMVISHTPALASYSDRVWKVVMKNDVSYLEGA